MSDLLLPGGNGFIRNSAQARQIAALTHDRDQYRQQSEHLKAHLAYLIVQAGGVVTIPVAELTHVYDLSAVTSEDEKSLIWSAARRVLQPAIEPATS